MERTNSHSKQRHHEADVDGVGHPECGAPRDDMTWSRGEAPSLPKSSFLATLLAMRPSLVSRAPCSDVSPHTAIAPAALLCHRLAPNWGNLEAVGSDAMTLQCHHVTPKLLECQAKPPQYKLHTGC